MTPNTSRGTMRLLARLDGRGRAFWMSIGLLCVAIVGTADVVTGREIAFSLFYLIPVALVTWYAGSRAGLAISVVAAITWFGADALDGQIYSHPIIRYWNAAIRFGFFVVVSELLPALKALDRERVTARIDHLTGAANRRHWYEVVHAELLRSQRYDRPFTIAYVDLDGFKAVNDQSGHRAGDRILRAVVDRATTHLRQTDLVARLGGDEFVVLLPEIDADEARLVVPKLQDALLDEMRASDWPVTFSIGVLTYRGGPAGPDDLIRAADKAMYSVKRNGKNSVAYAVYGR